MKVIPILLMSCMVFSTTTHADSLEDLTLTPAEMQKLKHYFPAEESGTLLWKGDALSVSLPVAQEKRIIFSAAVSVDLKGSLDSEQLRIINNNQSLYLTALKPFTTIRMYVTLQDSGSVLMIDLSTSHAASTKSQKIILQKSISPPEEDTNILEEASVDRKANNTITAVDLIRFAWQQTYAPKRLLTENLSYTRTAMHTQNFITGLVYGDKVIAHPEASWAAGNRYVTVIALRNKYPHKTELNLVRDVCGDWIAATLYPRSILQASGDKARDSTFAFLVSRKPFAETLGVCHGDA